MKRSNLVLDETISSDDSNAYRRGISTAIRNVIDELEQQGAKRVKDGFNERMFTFGVINFFLILYIFGVYPQHFWLLYLIEALYFVPIKFIQMIRAVPNEGFYYLDFCWIMNFGGIIALIVLMFGGGTFPEWVHRALFLTSFGVSCGPLLAADLAMPWIALIFHDVSSMTSLFIHIYPPLLLYSFRWRADEVKEAWPNTFRLDYDVDFFPAPGEVPFVQSIFGGSIILYLAWFVPYMIWLLSVGLALPQNGGKFDTVFHANMRNGLCVQFGTMFWKRPIELSIEQNRTNEFEMRDVGIYITGHVFGYVAALLLLAYPCSLSQYVHGSLLFICAVICTWRGAQRYTYYSTKMYSLLIRKQFAAELGPVDALSDEFGDALKDTNRDEEFVDDGGGKKTLHL